MVEKRIRITLECSWTDNITDYNNLWISKLFYSTRRSILGKSSSSVQVTSYDREIYEKKNKSLEIH